MDAPINEFDAEVIVADEEEVRSSWSVFNALYFLQANGWYILILSFLLYYLWKNKLSVIYNDWKRKKEEEEESVQMKKDEDKYKAWEKARREAIQRYQDNYNEQAAKMKEIVKEREEKKRQEYLARHSTVVGGRKLNEEYNPLMGKGGPSYRAPRHTNPGGSCGNR